MANSRRKCGYKLCTVKYGLAADMRHAGPIAYCDIECQLGQVKYNQDKQQKSKQLAEKKAAKEDKQKFAKRKREFYETDVKTRKAAAVHAFNAYIRERDRYAPCISCGKPIPDDDYCAGHYIPAGSNSLLKFNEYNVNGQHNNDCNKHRSGDQVRYRKGLIVKYGEAVVDELEATNGTIKRKPEDYKAIEVLYKQKLKDLQSRPTPTKEEIQDEL